MYFFPSEPFYFKLSSHSLLTFSYFFSSRTIFLSHSFHARLSFSSNCARVNFFSRAFHSRIKKSMKTMNQTSGYIIISRPRILFSLSRTPPTLFSLYSRGRKKTCAEYASHRTSTHTNRRIVHHHTKTQVSCFLLLALFPSRTAHGATPFCYGLIYLDLASPTIIPDHERIAVRTFQVRRRDINKNFCHFLSNHAIIVPAVSSLVSAASWFSISLFCSFGRVRQ